MLIPETVLIPPLPSGESEPFFFCTLSSGLMEIGWPQARHQNPGLKGPINNSPTQSQRGLAASAALGCCCLGLSGRDFVKKESLLFGVGVFGANTFVANINSGGLTLENG